MAALFALAVSARAQPAIRQNGVVNSASRIPPTLAGGAIARGARFTIYGVHFGSAARAKVIVSSGEKTVDAKILSASAEKIEAEMPASAPLGRAVVRVHVDSAETVPFPIDIVSENPGLFSRTGLGWGPGRIENIGTIGRSENSAANPAHPGQRVAITGTGFGRRPSIPVMIGGKAVKAARAKGEDGIEFSIPADVREGCYVPIYVLASPSRASNVVTISIRSGPGPCRMGPMPSLDGSVGLAVVSRTLIKPPSENADSIDDEAVAAFASTDQPALSPMLLLPPAGTCTAYTASLQDDAPMPGSISTALASIIGGRGLDAGSQLTIRGAAQSRRVFRVNGVAGYYQARLGQGGPNTSRRAPALFLDPGELHLAGEGGQAVGAFDAKVAAPLPFEWTGRDSISPIDRARPLTLHWRNAPRGSLIVISAMNLDQITTASGTAMCVADGSAGEFTIPAEILANLPASKDMPGPRYDRLALASIAAEPAPFDAAGLRNGAVIALYTVASYVRYR